MEGEIKEEGEEDGLVGGKEEGTCRYGQEEALHAPYCTGRGATRIEEEE